MADPKFSFLTEGLDAQAAPQAPTKDFGFLTEGLEDVKGPTPIDAYQRTIIQNLFDTDQKKRKAYLKKLGWDLDEDGNKIKPLGDKTPWADVADKIDYSPFEVPSQAKTLGAQIMAYAKETGMDVADIMGDIATGALSGAGAAAGGVAATPVGMTLLGAIAGGAAGEAMGEIAKQTIADSLLNLPDDIPNDVLGIAIQASIAGILPVVGDLPGINKLVRGGKDHVAKYLSERAAKSTKNVIREIEKTSAFKGRTRQTLEAMAKNPEDFTPEMQDEALGMFRKQYRSIMGIADDADMIDFAPTKTPNKIRPDSVFGQASRQLESAKQVAIDALDGEPSANIKLGDYIDILKGQADEIASIPVSQRTPMQQSALQTLSREMDLVAKDHAPKLTKQVVSGTSEKSIAGKSTVVTNMASEPLSQGELLKSVNNKNLSFREFQRSLNRMQDLVFEADPQFGFASENPIVGKVAGTLRQFRDEVAKRGEESLAKKGVQLPMGFVDATSKQAQVLRSYNTVGKKMSNPDGLVRAFQGVDTIAKQDLDDALGALDNVFGSKYKESFEGLSLADGMKKMREGLENQGSSSTVGRLATKAATGAGLGGAAGAMTPIGPVAGGLIGATAGAAMEGRNIMKYGSPERAFNTFRGALANEEAAGQTVNAVGDQASRFLNYLQASPLREEAFKQGERAVGRQLPDMTERTTEDDRLESIRRRLTEGL